ncbi:MAG: hypothetical protein U0359_35695 [Byssovorax sp.]
MRTPPSLLRRLAPMVLAAAAITGTTLAGSSCGSDVTTGAGGSGGGGSDDNRLDPGEVCTEPMPGTIKARSKPDTIFVPRCEAADKSCLVRPVEFIVDPDLCSTRQISFETSDADILPVPSSAGLVVDLRHPSVTANVHGGVKAGTATLTFHVKKQNSDAIETSAEVTVEVIDPAVPSCAGAPGASTAALKGGDSLGGTAGLAGATISLPQGADKPNYGTFLWSVSPFPATIACAGDLAVDGFLPLGPAVTFGPEALSFQRDVPLSIPLNPAMLPDKARFRHLRVAYSGPKFKTPRTIFVTDPHVEKVNGQWALTFKASRLGTYQVVIAKDAGQKTRKRRITHRAAVGISMGGGGTATFGMRHHDLFDVLAPLGGPVDWTWLLDYIETNHLGGFRPIKPGTQLADIQLEATSCINNSDCKADETCTGYISQGNVPGKCLLMPKVRDTYEHPQTFNTWWYEYPRTGNGGSFDRREYAQIFRDLAIMYGNPNGDNFTPGAENLPAGVRPDDLSQLGNHPNAECGMWVDPLDGPDHDKQQEIANSCPAERCAHTLTLNNYYDDEYNPDGKFPVITICDGSSQNEALTPYANTWHPGGNDYPLEVGLAVDYNGNGQRDELEPVIRAGHEPWSDVGKDGLASEKEPGYQLGVNEDPSGDDYDPVYNPTGTEGDRRYEEGEPFDDFGLDGVAGTKQQPPGGWQQPGDGYDVGEGDGKFTVTRGLQRFWDRDPHSIARQMVDPAKVPGGALTDEALSRIDLWTDGGTRDLFNFAVDAQHLMGAFSARGRDAVTFTDYNRVPGLDPTSKEGFIPSKIVFDDLQGVVFQRYGKLDPTQEDIDKGSGQHVGTANEILARLESAFYFIGSRWKEPELRRQHTPSKDNPAKDAPECQILGNCTFDFTSKSGRTGPVGITLPPGYANADLQNVRYPVIYVLHGYGQTPEDLEAVIVLASNWMNNALDSSGSRLPKAILVYVDGRCRIKDGKPECMRGTFFADSPMSQGAQDETWWLELMDYIDQNYRTLGESTVDWTE